MIVVKIMGGLFVLFGTVLIAMAIVLVIDPKTSWLTVDPSGSSSPSAIKMGLGFGIALIGFGATLFWVSCHS